MKKFIAFVLSFGLIGCAPSLVTIDSSHKPAGKIEAQKVSDKPVSFSVSGLPEWLNGGEGIKPQRDTIMCAAFKLRMKAEPGLSTTVKAMLSEVFSSIVDSPQGRLHFDFKVLEADASINGAGSEPLVGYRSGLTGKAKIVIKLQVTDAASKVIFKKTAEGEASQALSGRTCDPLYKQLGDVMKQAIEEALSTLAVSYFNTDEFKKL
jgi:hypothetical protein